VLYTIAHYGLFALYENSPQIAEQAVASVMEKFKARYGGELRGAP
jgi:hypothetical protein